MAQNGRSRTPELRRSYEVFYCRGSYPEERMLHHHDFYEVNLFWYGNLDYSIGSRIYHLTPGDILLLSPNELHQPLTNPEADGVERQVLWIDKAYLAGASEYGVDLIACFDTSSPGHTNCLRFKDDVVRRIATLMERVMQETSSDDFGSTMMAQSALLQIMVYINRLAQRDHQSVERTDRSGSQIGRVLDYINDHYTEELTLDTLAARFFISKYHLSREFVRITGTSVHRYIIQKRLAIAKQLLGEGRPSMEICQRCGFGDYSNFYRAFKNEYGISPKEFVAHLKQDMAYNAELYRARAWRLREGGE